MKKYLENLLKNFIILGLLAFYLFACGSKKPTSTNPGKLSSATGLPFNTEDGFQVAPFKNQAVGPGLVFIDGGSTVMGIFGDDTPNSPKKSVTVTSFYMKDTEVTNIEWKEYLDDLQKHDSEEAYQAALPNEKVWIRDLGYNDPYLQNYFQHPGFRFYPVVGVSWTQANNYCTWLTKVVNQQLVEDEDYASDNDEALAIESGLFVAGYRLPTEAEWEYAARAIVGGINPDLPSPTQRVYPWGDGLALRGQKGKYKGKYLANFKRSKGNYKGIAGETNNNAPTTYVYTYPPNDLGLYDMGGNVSEWVFDLYRPNSFQDFDDFNPVRRDDTLDPERDYDPSHSMINNRSRVYKGASWKDCAYWAQIGTRRFLDQDSSTAAIGFRVAMTSMGGGETQ
jgi:sulfatase modifying factor 1